MNPKGKVDRQSKPVPVRLFETKLEKLEIAQSAGNLEVAEKTIQKLKDDVAKLPDNNVVILDAKSTLDELTEQFWQRLNEDKLLFLQKDIAPLMRTRTGEDYKAMSFEIKVLQYSNVKMVESDKQDKKLSALEDVIIEMVSDLPLTVNVVAKQKDLIEEILNSGYLAKADDAALDVLIEKIAPLMKFRDEGVKPKQDTFDLKDITSEKMYIKFGPANERVTIQKYRDKVEALVKKLEEENETLQKIKSGDSISQEEVEELAETLAEYEPYPTEENLQKAYDARQVRFLDLIKYIMGIGGLVTFPEKVSEAFAEFIADHNTLTAKQIQFLHTLQMFIIENGSLTKKDLVREPFTKIHENGFLGVFDKYMQTEILNFTNQIFQYA